MSEQMFVKLGAMERNIGQAIEAVRLCGCDSSFTYGVAQDIINRAFTDFASKQILLNKIDYYDVIIETEDTFGKTKVIKGTFVWKEGECKYSYHLPPYSISRTSDD